MDRRLSLREILVAVLAAGVLLVVADIASACPTCKDSLAQDPASANLARGVYYSILFMLTMPYLIFGSLCAYFYWIVCRAKKRQVPEAETTAPDLAIDTP
jgi:heme/copper-type cytochrome/quinol oxidase subunit 2